jgi:transposase InsO family protein
MPIPERRWESVGMDFIVGLPCSKDGYDSILVIIDRLSKYVKLVPTITTVTATEVARLFVDHVMKSHGCPKSIVSDRDKNFTSHFWRTVCELWQIEQLMSTAFHPQTDGQTERVNRVLEEYLRSYVSPLHDNWDQYLPMAEFAINNSKQASTGMSPFEMMYGEAPYMPLGLADTSRECPAGKQFAESC